MSFTPRRKSRNKERPPEDGAYNRAFSRVRTKVEPIIGQLRRYQALAQTDRHPRVGHQQRVQARAGLGNRQLNNRLFRDSLAA